MGLMKLAMYHRLQKWDVVFYKGDLKAFVISQYVDKALLLLKKWDSEFFWPKYVPDIFSFIKTGKINAESEFDQILRNSLFAIAILDDVRQEYKHGLYFEEKPWDRVCVTTLFTFYAKITYQTIEFAKNIVKDLNQLMVGGIMASVVPDEIEKVTGIKPFQGCIYDKFIFDDKPINQSIDSLPLDYSILDEIDYSYPEQNAYYGYTTRGCVNRCPFCAVPRLEPEYQEYIPLSSRIEDTRERFGEQKDLLLLDNNIFASAKYDQIIDEIKSCGFARGAKFLPSNPLKVIIKQLECSWNDRAYIRKGVKLLNQYLSSLRSQEEKAFLTSAMEEHALFHDYTATKNGVLSVCKLIEKEYSDRFQAAHRPVVRYVDFNQGVDARLATESKIKKLSTIAIRPLRVAFDDWKFREKYTQAIYYASKYKIPVASNYLLYNFKDDPIDLYNRLRLNVDLSYQLGITIYSFPMKYHPIMEPEWFDNRHYIGEKWCRKYIRTIQIILNATKGKVGASRPFFYTAFGKDENAYRELLYMPEAFVLYRYDAEAKGLTKRWRDAYEGIAVDEKERVNEIVRGNEFNYEEWANLSRNAKRFLEYYLMSRDDIPECSQSQKNRIKKKYIESCPEDISDTCRELLARIRK